MRRHVYNMCSAGAGVIVDESDDGADPCRAEDADTVGNMSQSVQCVSNRGCLGKSRGGKLHRQRAFSSRIKPCGGETKSSVLVKA